VNPLPKFSHIKTLFHTRQYRQTGSGITVVGPRYGLGARQWVLPRAFCLFRMIRVDTIPQGDLRNAIDLQIMEWSPYVETGQYVVQVGKRVLVWIWDQKKHVLEAEKQGAVTVPVIPETLLRPPETADGVCLVACLIGCEGQIWEDGAISASHWWAEPPSAEQWFQFLLRNDESPADLPPVRPETELLVTPWGRGKIDLQVHLQANEHRIVKCLALMLSLYLVWLGSSAMKTSSGITSVRAAIKEKEKQVAPILGNRAQALDYRERISHLDELSAYPSQLEVIDAVVGIIPAGEIRKWEYQQGALTVLLTGDKLDPQVLVQRLEAAGLFAQVVAQRGKMAGQFDVTMQVRKKGEKP
jgi:hypothetical protein